SRLRFSFSADTLDVLKTITATEAIELWVTDEAGNQDFCASAAQVASCSELEITGTVTPTCGGNDGAIVLDTLPITNQYLYIWSVGDSTRNINALAAGEYTVTVLDQNNCSYTESFTVPAGIAIELATEPACNDDGTANVEVTAGTPPYEFTWAHNSERGAFQDDLSAGTYPFTVVDASNCTAIGAAVIENRLDVQAYLGGRCSDQSNEGVVEITSGTPPYTFAWSNGETDSIIQVLPDETYGLTVTDADGCIWEEEDIDFLIAAPLNIFLFGIANCNGSSIIIPTVSGGAPPYTYQMTGPDGYFSDNTIRYDDLFDGLYTLVVEDANGCTAAETYNLVSETNLDFEQDIEYACDGTATVTLTPRCEGTYDFSWSNGGVGSKQEDLVVGNYTITITDNRDSVRIYSLQIESIQTLSIEEIRTFPNCYMSGGSFSGIVSNGEPPYVFRWIINDTTVITQNTGFLSDRVIGDLVVDRYRLIVSDSRGCVATSETFEVDFPPFFRVELAVEPNCEDNTFTISPSVFEEGTLLEPANNYQFEWYARSLLIDSSQQIDIAWNDMDLLTSLIITGNNNTRCRRFINLRPTLLDSLINIGACTFNTISGVTFLDSLSNCIFDSGDIGISLADIEIALVKDTLLDTDLVVLENGTTEYISGVKYESELLENGRFDLLINLLNPFESDYTHLKISTDLPSQCAYRYVALADLLDETASIPDIQLPIQLEADCDLLTVDIATPFLRRCFESTYHVSYCNYGINTIEDAYIEVQLDEYVDFVRTNIPATDLGEGLYRFDLGTIEAGACGRFPIIVKVSCDAVLGQTHCAEATIFPIPDCLKWEGAAIEVTGTCEADSVLFRIQNIGEVDMDAPLNYIAIEDVVMLRTDDFQLEALEATTLRFPKNGSTYRLQVEQVEGLPYKSQPSTAIEACGSNDNGSFSLGFVNLFPEDDAAPFRTIHCEENRGAYDPNDKAVLPKGVDKPGYIDRNVDLEYKIRFQNTGTDTAFTVVILDTLDTWLDPTTVQAGASSHDYVFELIDDRVLRFAFYDILLPDSTTNLGASQGFVQFRVAQQMDIPFGETINNKAAIYFDFNEPIITNTVSNQIEKDFLKLALSTPEVISTNIPIRIHPNPFRESTIIYIGGEPIKDASFVLYDTFGRLLMEKPFSGNQIEIFREKLPENSYFFQIVSPKGIINTGKLIISN
ncbi:MAG: T9SS type A sorting domain-containing protein, partial [Bacteroidota bacterium]